MEQIFFGNTDGLNWFIHDVLPKSDITLTIVGKGMSKAFENSNQVKVYDFVESLDDFYQKADMLIIPTITGGGMKTKTAEAMMWGKVILGTSNAFEGYITQNVDGLFVCNTAEEFIDAIKKVQLGKYYRFNESIYHEFIDNYSTDVITEKFSEFISYIK